MALANYVLCIIILLDGYIPCISIMHATICIPGMYNPIQNYYTKETAVFLGTFHIGTELAFPISANLQCI